jgi:hypothetical protein
MITNDNEETFYNIDSRIGIWCQQGKGLELGTGQRNEDGDWNSGTALNLAKEIQLMVSHNSREQCYKTF